MTISQAVSRRFVQSNNQVLAAFERGGAILPNASLRESITLITSAFAANAAEVIDLSQVGYTFQPLTLFLKGTSSATIATISVQQGTIAGLNFTVLVSQGFANLPFMVLSPDSKLSITLDANTNGVYIFGEQRAVLENQAVIFE